jgi:hypothetical protein
VCGIAAAIVSPPQCGPSSSVLAGVSNWRIRRSSPCRSSDRKRVRRHGPVGPGVLARDRLRVAPATPSGHLRRHRPERVGRPPGPHKASQDRSADTAGPGWVENRYHLGSTRPTCRIERSSVQRSVPLGFQVPTTRLIASCDRTGRDLECWLWNGLCVSQFRSSGSAVLPGQVSELGLDVPCPRRPRRTPLSTPPSQHGATPSSLST